MIFLEILFLCVVFSFLKCNRMCGKMLVMSSPAVFLWLLFTFTAADLVKNGNENTNGTEKSNRTSSTAGGDYKETKRFRQHRLLSEDPVVQSAKPVDGVDDTSTKTTETIRSRHLIKTKHKHKRMWHELSPPSSSNEPKNNNSKPSTDNIDKTADTKELIKSNVNDTANLLITIDDDGVSIDDDRVPVKQQSNNDDKANAANNAKSNDTSDNDDNVKQINTPIINDKAKNVAGNEDMGSNGNSASNSSRVKIQRITSARVVAADNSNSTTPSHRKKRRRILFSSTQPVPTESQSQHFSNFQPIEQSFGQEHVPYVDFGRKIAGGGVAPRGHVNFYDSLFTEIRSRPLELPKPFAVSEEEPIHEDMDVTMDRKTIEKNHVPNDRLHVASTNLANYYRRSTTKPTTSNTTTANSTVCIPPYRIRRPYTGASANKTLKREINQNIPLCQYNFTTTTKIEDVKPTDKPEPKKVLKNRTDSPTLTTYKIIESFKNDSSQVQVTESSTVASVEVTTPIANQFTTKILSTAVITSVSVKSNNDDLTVPSEPYISSMEIPKPGEYEETRKKSKSEKSFDATYNSSGVVFSALNKNKPIQSTARPSLSFYQRNTSKNFRSSTRNLQFSKPALLSQLQLHSSRPVVNSTTSDRPETNTKQYQVQPSIVSVLNISEANIEYLLGADNPTTESAEPEADSVDAEITTNELFNPKPTVVIVTVHESENLPVSADYDRYNASSTPSIIAFSKNTERNTENWRYRTNVENDESSLENSTSSGSQIPAIFSKSSLLNFTKIVVPVVSTTPKLSAKPSIKPSAEEYAVGFQIGFHIVIYVLAVLGTIPLIIGIFLIAKMILTQNKKQIFEGSEYSSEYNRNPLEFNGGVTSSPIATKLPRVPHHMAHWEIEKKAFSSISLPNNSKWEFPRDKLRLQTILGQGNFGQVWKAEADDISGHEGLTRLVAVKMVKEISSTREKEDLIKELVIMQHLGSHPNVVTLLGCCTEKEPYMLIMEYVMYGKLLSFLRDHRTRSHYFNFSDNGDTLTSRDLTVFAYCVARGMEYLQNKQIIHRDLAARNILVDHNKLCKIADFGMSRHVGESGQVLEHRQSKGALPIRWMAPESLHYSCYTHKTDVWSFGILMWEIVTLGSMPYASMGARVVMRKVKEGYRLEKPKHCKSQLFNVINKCWYSDPNKRPTFSELKQDLGNLLEDSEHDGNYVDLDSLVEEMNQLVHASHNEKII